MANGKARLSLTSLTDSNKSAYILVIVRKRLMIILSKHFCVMLSPPHLLLIKCAYKKTLRTVPPVKGLHIKIMLIRLLPLLLNSISLWLSVPPSPVVPHAMCMPMLMRTLILLNSTTIPLTMKCHPLILMSPLTSIQQLLRSRRLILTPPPPPPRLPPATWHTVSRAGQRTWASLSSNDKASIISGLTSDHVKASKPPPSRVVPPVHSNSRSVHQHSIDPTNLDRFHAAFHAFCMGSDNVNNDVSTEQHGTQENLDNGKKLSRLHGAKGTKENT